MSAERACAECWAPCPPSRTKPRRFCSFECKQAWHNRWHYELRVLGPEAAERREAVRQAA